MEWLRRVGTEVVLISGSNLRNWALLARELGKRAPRIFWWSLNQDRIGTLQGSQKEGGEPVLPLLWLWP